MTEQETRERKLEELRQSYLKEQEEKRKELNAETQANAMMRKYLDEPALERLNNVKLVNKELFFKAFNAIMHLVQNGHVREKITDAEAKSLLMQLKGKEREISIKRK